uniref:Uncharacterized protein n=1 Tax=Heterorhabditis bacteriophora TaxID=37862 RepID=A0A1I7WDD5_HETBA
MAGQDTKLESKAHTYKRPQDCLITSPTSALASASHERNHTSISEQANRPDHWSQSFSRSYGSNLPTSLTYIILSTRGPDADIGTMQHRLIASLGFSRSTRHHRNRGALRKQRPYLRMNRFQGVQKKTLARSLSDVTEFECVTAQATQRATISMSALENINSIPFRYPREKKLLPLDDTSILGSTDPHSTLFTWNPSPLQSSRIELKYLLLPPRSALMEAPAGPTP